MIVRTPRTIAAIFAAWVLLVACADEPTVRPGGGGDDPPRRYRVDAFVLEDASHGPELCLGGVADSLPPQCSGIPLDGWDWDAVEGEDAQGGARWGQFDVVGTYDGATFTVLEAGPAVDEGVAPDEPVDWMPCDEPSGGWTSRDPSLADDAALQEIGRTIEDEPDYAGHWIDYVEEPTEYVDPGGIILVAAFTGDLERHESEIRAMWGGPLCMTQHERTHDELRRIQREVGDDGDVSAELGLEVTFSSVDVVSNSVQVGVVLVPDGVQGELAERYGQGAVVLFPALRPVD